MRNPNEFETQQLLDHILHEYDPAKAHEYYERTKKLKGRRKGSRVVNEDGSVSTRAEAAKKTAWKDPRTGKTMEQIKKEARVKQKKELKESIDKLEDRLKKLEQLIKERMRKEASEDRKGKAKKERAAKEATKPDSAAEKAEKAREAEKYRDKNQQKIKADAKKTNASGGGSKSRKKSKSGKKSVSELKSLATKVKGQLKVAKQKLAAL